MKSILLMMATVMVGGMLFLNCKGDDGQVGPTGNANVIYSGWAVAKLFSDSISDNSNVKVGHISAPLITQNVLDSGMVFVYMNYGAGPMQLPYTSYAGGKPNTINFWIKLGKIIPYRFTHDNSNSVNLSATLQYRYIILPGGTPAAPAPASGRVAGLDYSDYNAVCKYYGIPL